MMMLSGTKSPLRKTTSLLSKNQSHPSMDQHHHLPRQQSTGFLGRRTSRRSPHTAELFPTSPEVPPMEDGIFHLTHPQHPIMQTSLPDLFTCGACKEYGAGERFSCTKCDYQLHDFCALAPATLRRHPIHPLHNIVFITKSGIYFLFALSFHRKDVIK
ncbi:Cysteine/Histidine-rich C1 domain family protein, putative isoform 2 [Hibiscus syriacus]|uniref:Cysteine/Histidine-rich C1 domain family protein, putative isoform 2 n=1 Tax=Hibiscus syriacus TaxID=106335 RepID=A0A6A2Y5F6_HIBSY|nr:Cysteine/Histidine-rich C1 domain family protein, putative isoform 2 [Hibiscus syriacus]